MNLAKTRGAMQFTTLAWKKKVEDIRKSFLPQATAGKITITTSPAPTSDFRMTIAPRSHQQSELRQGVRAYFPVEKGFRKTKQLDYDGERRIDKIRHNHCQAKDYRLSKNERLCCPRHINQGYFAWMAEKGAVTSTAHMSYDEYFYLMEQALRDMEEETWKWGFFEEDSYNWWVEREYYDAYYADCVYLFGEPENTRHGWGEETGDDECIFDFVMEEYRLYCN